MSSSSVSYAAAPGRGATAATARGREGASAPARGLRIGRGPVGLLLGATALLALWIALWSFFIVGVVAPAGQLHRAPTPTPTPTPTATPTSTATATRE